MWIVLLGFAFTTVLLAWLLCGYLIWLRFIGDAAARSDIVRPAEYPKLSILVPCFNEESLIADKYRNLMQCAYPSDRIEIIFADGGSTDDTTTILESLIEHDGANVRLARCPIGGKINQMNHVLPSLRGDIVVITDADARLAPDALEWIAAEFEADPQVALVGACTSPRGGLAIERAYWAAQNRVRLLESRVSHVSIVAACCYAFKRDLLSQFPTDVVADDVHAVALANTLGYHTIYSRKATVEELRTPISLTEFFTHKYRKGNAVLREMLRFCYRLPDMDGRWKSILTTCLAQQLILPWAIASWVAMAATLTNFGQVDVVALAVAILLVAVLSTRKAVQSIELPTAPERFGPVTVVLACCYTLGVLCATTLTYTFFRQNSSYARLQGMARPGPRIQQPQPPRQGEAASESPPVTRGQPVVSISR